MKNENSSSAVYGKVESAMNPEPEAAIALVDEIGNNFSFMLNTLCRWMVTQNNRISLSSACGGASTN